MRNIIEWFFMLFLRKKAEIIRQEAFKEREKAIIDYAVAKKCNNAFLSKFSGKKRYVKTGNNK